MADRGIELKFDGHRYGLWQNVGIRMSVDDLCASVGLLSAGIKNDLYMPVSANTVIEVLLNDKLVTTIRPDVLKRKMGEDSHDREVEGRSLARELVDCQVSKTLSGLKLEEIIKRLCSMFNVPVKIDAKTEVVPKFAMQAECPANAIINAVRTANLLLYPLPSGGLILTMPSAAEPVATLESGLHFKSYVIIDEFRLRYSEYYVKAYNYDSDRGIRGRSHDRGITFYRPLHIIADRLSSGVGSCERRAILERNRRLARAHRLELEVFGWSHTTDIWKINEQVRVIIPEEEIDEVYLIGEIEFKESNRGGRTTRLQVMHRSAFEGEEKKGRHRVVKKGTKNG